MDIRSALDQLVTIQAALTISSPISATIAKAYKYFPPQSTILPDLPCFMNAWTLINEERAGGERIQNYVVHMQLFVRDGDQDRAADIASAFLAALMDALDLAGSLSGTCAMQTLRGGSPTLAVLERANQAFIGLDLFLDVVLKEGHAFAA